MNASKKTIHKIELEDYEADITCPQCNQTVLSPESDEQFNPCPHTLFIAHDVGFEFRDERFDRAMGISGVDSLDLDLDESIDEFTDRVPLENSVKYAAYVPAPSFFGSYVGFQLEPENQK